MASYTEIYIVIKTSSLGNFRKLHRSLLVCRSSSNLIAMCVCTVNVKLLLSNFLGQKRKEKFMEKQTIINLLKVVTKVDEGKNEFQHQQKKSSLEILIKMEIYKNK